MANLIKLNRKVHYWIGMIVAVPVLVVIGSGVLLQLKKNWTWIQPAEQTGSSAAPELKFEQILDTVRRIESLEVRDWGDVRRLDVRPNQGIVKALVKNGWEAQIDLGTGEVMQVSYRRSDIIEAIHDGSFFAGNWTKLGVFLPAGLALLLLWCTGIWMLLLPVVKRRKRTSLPQEPGSLGKISDLTAGVFSWKKDFARKRSL
jgi:uncharacterized iron-regulated membrane protein